VDQTLPDLPDQGIIVFGIFIRLLPFLEPKSVVQLSRRVPPLVISFGRLQLSDELSFTSLTNGCVILTNMRDREVPLISLLRNGSHFVKVVEDETYMPLSIRHQ
jgi:hypothetical protein